MESLLLEDQWNIKSWGFAIILIMSGFVISQIIAKKIIAILQKKLSKQHSMLIHKLILYGIFLVFLIMALQQVGFQLSVLVGTAGVLTIAVGFASQAAISNIISGLFIILEQPFKVGDDIKLGNQVGEILSIDLLSIKLLKKDNTLLRVPNETILKSNIENLSYYNVIRHSMDISISCTSDLEKALETLNLIFKSSNLCLKEPQPIITIEQIAETAIIIKCFVWTKMQNVNTLKNELFMEIKQVFDKQKIKFAQPRFEIKLIDS